MSENPAPLMSMRNIGKSFAGVQVLADVDFDIYPGEVHILAGENGAGKSTLIKILGGVHTEYEGTIHSGGKLLRFHSPHDAARQGVAVIHQEMSLIPSMSAADNVFLGRERTSGGFLNRGSQHTFTRKLVGQFGIDVDVTSPVENFPMSVQQMIEIAKALAFDARVIVMDEPTSALTEPEVVKLFSIIADLKQRGCGIVYISHKMQEIYQIAQRITVLRDGKFVGSGTADEIPQQRLVNMMVGREITQQFPEHVSHRGEPRIVVRDFSLRDPAGSPRMAVQNVSLTAHAGEIVGIAGLQGSGNSELLNGIFGTYGPKVRGMVEVGGRRLRFGSPAHSVAAGMALLTNDRKTTGLVLNMSIIRNTTLASLPKFSPGWILQPSRERAAAIQHANDLRIRAASLDNDVVSLSGGNQQKVVLAKWLQTKPNVLLLDEPTRGVDVGAKAEIYALMNRLSEGGCCILLITSEMPELLAMSDRILVMHRGKITAEFARGEATQENILEAAMGLQQAESA